MAKFVNSWKRFKKVRRVKGVDDVTEQVKKVLEDRDQQLILMVRN
ncbi:MAG: hypothetical protein Q8P92_00760 [Candidatus Daviesbacteria bacterium]|nr:hypothetical protein [Candidatus Daviesbacteria bacterium]